MFDDNSSMSHLCFPKCVGVPVISGEMFDRLDRWRVVSMVCNNNNNNNRSTSIAIMLEFNRILHYSLKNKINVFNTYFVSALVINIATVCRRSMQYIFPDIMNFGQVRVFSWWPEFILYCWLMSRRDAMEKHKMYECIKPYNSHIFLSAYLSLLVWKNKIINKYYIFNVSDHEFP